ncbi:hypothetical protein Cantr_04165 [Candida viswanathii]|uniref:Uncharacterized protein n=1 Tax=Candida viswanathii TaxID=5486 RepID=A0A367XNY2_9ASCO|nr:hypothetical protein Cantr_04165 [Candida viswanathii]
MSSTSSPNVSNSDLDTLSDLLRTSSPTNQSPHLQSLNIAKAQITATPEDKLIELQTRKIELLERRDELVKSRAKLYNEVNDLRVSLHDLTKDASVSAGQKRVEELLDANTRAYIDALELRNLKNDDYVLNNLNVLPATDWGLRLEYIKKFVPFLEIDKINTFNEHVEGDMMRVIEFEVILPLIFKLGVKLSVNCEDDALSRVEVLDTFKIAVISNSFAQTLTRNYIPHRKINSIMYGLNSFSKLLHARISIVHKIVTEFRDNLYDGEKYHDLLQETVADNKKNFATLQNIDQIELKFVVGERLFKLALNWGIVMGDTSTGSCQSQINLYIIDDIGNTRNLSQIFQSLLLQYDVITSLKVIIKNIF